MELNLVYANCFISFILGAFFSSPRECGVWKGGTSCQVKLK